MSGLIELLGRLGWTVSEGYELGNASACRRCGHEVLWCRSRGRSVPLDRDGSRHPTDCRVGISAVQNRDQGHGGLRKCPKCRPGLSMEYSVRDLGAHLKQAHGGA